MAHTNRNFVIAYILLVGIPLLGLVGVLRRGRTLTAPVSVNGTWKIEADTVRLAALPCGKSVSNASMLISQSGKDLRLTLSGGSKAASGVIEGKTIKASFASTNDPSSNDVSCASGRSFTLTAALDPKSDPRTLSGILSVDGCASCAPLEFKAVRQPLSSREGAR